MQECVRMLNRSVLSVSGRSHCDYMLAVRTPKHSVTETDILYNHSRVLHWWSVGVTVQTGSNLFFFLSDVRG